MAILNLSFNQLISHLVCCTDSGYIIYALLPSIEKKIYNDKKGGIGIMKMLNKTNIGIMVGGGENPFRSKDTMILWDDLKNNSIIEVDLREQIKNCLINKDKIVAVLEKKLCIFNFDGSLIDMRKTYCNKDGICVMSYDDTKPIIVSVGSRKGEVSIWKINHETHKTIQAHTTNIKALTISRDGSKIATASETGTLIKVYDTETCNLLYTFRRGTTSAEIFDLSFNWDATYLACCSGNGTVHIFELYKNDDETKNNQSMLSGWKDYLPTYFGSFWSFKQHYLETTSKMICEFDNAGVLHIATFDGKYLKITGAEFDNIKSDNLHFNFE